MADDGLSGIPTEAELVLPPLPEPTPPEYIGGNNRYEVYAMMDQMRQHIEGHDATFREALMVDPQLATAIFRILHESHCLRDGTGASVPLPDVAPPQLPPGYKTWLLRASDLRTE